MAARIAVGVLVVAVLAWLAIGLRNARLEADGASLIGSSPATASPERLAEARDAYRRAGERNPDTGPEIRAAGIANFTGQPEEAVELLRDVVRREPENFDAWLVLASAAAEIDPPLAERARERARSLNPLQFRRPG
jgi:tetratricopeptide (TPR) repeat protein